MLTLLICTWLLLEPVVAGAWRVELLTTVPVLIMLAGGHARVRGRDFRRDVLVPAAGLT